MWIIGIKRGWGGGGTATNLQRSLMRENAIKKRLRSFASKRTPRIGLTSVRV